MDAPRISCMKIQIVLPTVRRRRNHEAPTDGTEAASFPSVPARTRAINVTMTKKTLSQGRMKNSDLILQHGNAQAAEDALQHDGKRCGNAEPPKPAPRLAQPKPDSQNSGQQPNE